MILFWGFKKYFYYILTIKLCLLLHDLHNKVIVNYFGYFVYAGLSAECYNIEYSQVMLTWSLSISTYLLDRGASFSKNFPILNHSIVNNTFFINFWNIFLFFCNWVAFFNFLKWKKNTCWQFYLFDHHC